MLLIHHILADLKNSFPEYVTHSICLQKSCGPLREYIASENIYRYSQSFLNQAATGE